jgi:hypothetical protein
MRKRAKILLCAGTSSNDGNTRGDHTEYDFSQHVESVDHDQRKNKN